MRHAKESAPVQSTFQRRAGWILASFLFTFMTARIVVYLILARRIPDLYLYVGGTHIHHLNYGIFMLSGVGAYLLLKRPTARSLHKVCVLYGIGLALTFDEFGMWLRLESGSLSCRLVFFFFATVFGISVCLVSSLISSAISECLGAPRDR